MMSRRRKSWQLFAPALLGAAMLAATGAQAQKTSEASSADRSTNAITGRLVIQGGETASGAIAMANPIGISAQGRTTTVDSNGSFKFDRLDAGVYSVSAYLPGYIPQPPTSPEESRRYYHTGDSVTLTMVKGGVITGTVMTASNGPVVAAAVRAIRVKDVNGQPEPAVVQIRDRQTDDRGVYRFYGLAPGTYLISAGGQGRMYGGNLPGAYDNDPPTYAPSSTRDTAMEVVVRSGETFTVDIQYHNDSGQIISGTLVGLIESNSMGTSIAVGTVTLTDVRSHATLMSVGASSFTGSAFAFNGVPDGEYEILAQQYLPTRDVLVSEPRRIKVEGADISGLKLSVAPLGSISGRLVLESNPPADCVIRRETAAVESVVIARHFKPEEAAGKAAKSETPVALLGATSPRADGVPDAKGDFVIRNLRTGLYRIDSELPGPGWYLRAITIGTQSIPARSSEPNVARDGLTLKAGERVSGLTVTIAEGAASLRGRVSVAASQALPSGLIVYLVPAERESRDDIPRFFESRADNDGAFAINNVAPGKYWILARPDDDSDPRQARSVRRDSAWRTQILREAESLKKEIAFKPCARTNDYDLPYAVPTAAPK